MCSNLFIVSMTFQRFYSIIRPHKAASFNTVKRAKITIASIVMFSFIFRFPHLFTSYYRGRTCFTFGDKWGNGFAQVYYWVTFTLISVIPFVSLIIMNSIIIKTLSDRSKSNLNERVKTKNKMQSPGQVESQGQYQGQGQGQDNILGQAKQIKNSERQIYTMLLLVSFSYLILTTPMFAFLLYNKLVNFLQSPYHFAVFTIFYQVAEKTFYCNFGINFFLYVLSGQKFREDLVSLFTRKTRNH